MPRLTKEEVEDMKKPLAEPGPNAREFGKRGIISARAIHEERVIAEAEEDMLAKGDTNVPHTY